MCHRAIASALVAVMLTACGGGSSTSQSALPSGAGGTNAVAVTFAFPATKTLAKSGRKPNYVPILSRGMGIDFGASPQAYAATPNATPMIGAPLVAGSAPCTAAQADGSYSCTVYMPAVPVGYDDFRVSLWNAAPTGCTFPAVAGCSFATASALTTTVVPFQAVKQGQNNQFAFSFSATVDSIYVSLSGGFVDGTPSPITATLTEKDPQGFIILNSPQFFDKNGNALTITLNLVNGAGSLAFAGSNVFTSVGAAPSQVTINYNGVAQLPSSGAAQPAVSVTLSGPGTCCTLGGSALGANIAITQTNAGGIGVPSVPQIATVGAAFASPAKDLALGSDGNIWVSSGTNFVKVTSAGVETSVANPTGGTIRGMLGGRDGDIWFWDSTNVIGRFSPLNFGGTFATLAVGASQVDSLTFGDDGNVYAAEQVNDTVLLVQPNNFTAAPIALNPPWSNSATGGVEAVVAGPRINGGHPSVCAIDYYLKKVGCLDTTTRTYGTVGTAANKLLTAVYAPDGNLYVGSDGNGVIEAFAVDGTGNVSASATKTYQLPLGIIAPALGVTGMVTGPDGNLWIVTPGSVAKLIIASSSPSLQEYRFNTGVTFSGPPANLPWHLIVGANLKLYTVDRGSAQQLYSISL